MPSITPTRETSKHIPSPLHTHGVGIAMALFPSLTQGRGLPMPSILPIHKEMFYRCPPSLPNMRQRSKVLMPVPSLPHTRKRLKQYPHLPPLLPPYHSHGKGPAAMPYPFLYSQGKICTHALHHSQRLGKGLTMPSIPPTQKEMV